MTDTAKLYVETANGLIDSESAQTAAALLSRLAVNQDDITFTGDEHGHYFSIPAELLDAFRAELEKEEEPEVVKPRRGRPRKVVESDLDADNMSTEEPEQE